MHPPLHMCAGTGFTSPLWYDTSDVFITQIKTVRPFLSTSREPIAVAVYRINSSTYRSC